METAWRVCSQCMSEFWTQANFLLPIDIFLVCDEGNGQKSYQIWLNKKSQGFLMARQGPLPSGAQSVSFGDIGKLGLLRSPYVVILSLQIGTVRLI